MRVTWLHPQGLEQRLLEVASLCSDAHENNGSLVGDPLEIAVLEAARDAGVDVSALRKVHALRDEFTFDSERKLMSVDYDRDRSQPDSQNSTGWAAVKGAPEAALARTTRQWLEGQALPLDGTQRPAILHEAARMAGQGLRVIACAEKAVIEDHLA